MERFSVVRRKESALTERRSYVKAFLGVPLLMLAAILLGCNPTSHVPPVSEELLRAEMPSDAGLAFGRIQLEGWPKTILAPGQVHAVLRYEPTQQLLTHTLDPSGEFFWTLPAGSYQLTAVWSGFRHVGTPVEGDIVGGRFAVLPGKAVYVGALVMQAPTPTRKGELAVLDEFEAATQSLHARYPTLSEHVLPVKGLMFTRRMTQSAGIVVDALVNGKIAVPLLLDTGASYTTLTRQNARDLGILSTDELPKERFHAFGGVVLVPVTTVQSLRVGTAEAREVKVAIDGDGRLPIGLLGMTFLRHFKFTVDQPRSQVTFTRSL